MVCAGGGAVKFSRSIRTEMMTLCVVSGLLIALFSLQVAYHMLEKQALQRSLLMQYQQVEQRSLRIDDYIDQRLRQMVDLSRSDQLMQAMDQFSRLFSQGVDSQAYRRADRLLHARLLAVNERWGYHDAFLITPQGQVVFSVAHESDFATNLNDDAFRHRGLARAFRNALQLLTPDVSSFAYYPPSHAQAAFIATPLILAHRLAGVLAFQLDTQAFYELLGDLSGLGKSGEVMAVARNGSQIMLTAPLRHDPKAAFSRVVASGSSMADALQQALQGETGAGALQDAAGRQLVGAWSYLPALDWGLLVHQDRDEALHDLAQLSSHLLIATISALMLVLVLVAWRSSVMLAPLRRLTRAIEQMQSQRRISEEISESSPLQELNQLSAAFNRMYQEIDRHHRHLEEMVEARTAELSRLHLAVEQTRDIIIITDRHGIIEYVNPAFETVTGYSREEAIGRTPNICKSGEMSASFYQQMWDTILAGGTWQADFINRNRAGERYVVAQVISPIRDSADRVTGFVSVQRDVTRERQQQRQMEHTQRLESLGVLAGGIAHDFNNLLAAIMGNAGLARMRARDDATLAKLIRRIEEASERAADLCKQMLAYSGKGKFVVEPINMSALVEQNMEILKVSISKHVLLQSDLSPVLPPILGDRAQMQQVVMNLVINASEAIGDQEGVIRLRTGTVMVDAAYLRSSHIDEPLPVGGYVYIEVSDNGCGMDAQTRKKLYDPFFTTKFTGRGLGMSAILGIVRGHHGAIQLYSEPGHGSRFKILLPVANEGAVVERDAADDSHAVLPAAAWHGVVLVVDDEAMIRETAASMLKQLGLDVLLAVDGADGVAQYREHWQRIDLVLLDMTMPKLDGKEAFEAMKQINPSLQVLLSSGYNEQETTSQFAGEGLAGFVQKPYRFEQLRDQLARFFAQDDAIPGAGGADG